MGRPAGAAALGACVPVRVLPLPSVRGLRLGPVFGRVCLVPSCTRCCPVPSSWRSLPCRSSARLPALPAGVSGPRLRSGASLAAALVLVLPAWGRDSRVPSRSWQRPGSGGAWPGAGLGCGTGHRRMQSPCWCAGAPAGVRSGACPVRGSWARRRCSGVVLPELPRWCLAFRCWCTGPGLPERRARRVPAGGFQQAGAASGSAGLVAVAVVPVSPAPFSSASGRLDGRCRSSFVALLPGVLRSPLQNGWRRHLRPSAAGRFPSAARKERERRYATCSWTSAGARLGCRALEARPSTPSSGWSPVLSRSRPTPRVCPVAAPPSGALRRCAP